MPYKQAALLYLILFNIGEADLSATKAKRLEKEVENALKRGKWPSKNLIFDNEGEPMVEWEAFGAPKEWNFLDYVLDNLVIEECFNDYWDNGKDLNEILKNIKP